MAGAGFGKNHVPEVLSRGSEPHPNEPMVILFADGSHNAFDGVRGHLIENPDHLAREQRSIHDNECAVAANILRGSPEVNEFAFGHLATDPQRNFKCDSDSPTTLRVS